MIDFKRKLLVTCSHNTPLSSAFYYNNFNLNEGLISTYSINKVKEYVDDLLDIPGNEYLTKIDNDKFRIIYYNIKDNRKLVSQAMTLCGYVLSKEALNGEYIEQCYIPKYSGDVTDIIHERMQYLMHISPSYYKDKILKQGLVPKSKHKDFGYNERVYLFIQNTPSNEVFYQANEFRKKLTNGQNNSKYTVFYIKVDSLPKDVKLYIDTTYSFGVYTMDNVPPSAIYKTFDFDLDNLFESFAVKNN